MGELRAPLYRPPQTSTATAAVAIATSCRILFWSHTSPNNRKIMGWLRLLSMVLYIVMLTRCEAAAASAGPRGQGGGGGGDGGGGGGQRSKLVARSYHRLPARARHASDAEDFMLDDEELIDVPKRTYSDYGHMRFGKRDDKFDDYGHMRFGRADY